MRYKVYSKQLNGVEKLHRLKLQPTFSESFQTEQYEFPVFLSECVIEEPEVLS